MKRSRLKNIINKSREFSNKPVGESPFESFKKSLPIEVDDSYRLEAAWKAYGSPKDYKEALWQGLIQPIDETNVKLPSIGYNEETDEYEYLNKGKENETVDKDIRVWDNDVIPLVKELKLGGYIRTYNEEKECWTYSKNKPQENQEINRFQFGGNTPRLGKPIWELVNIAKRQNPRFVQRMSEPYKDTEFIDKEGNKARGTHYMMYQDKEVFPTIQEMPDGSLKHFKNIKEAYENAKKNNNILKFDSEEDAKEFSEKYKEGWPIFFEKALQAEQKNTIQQPANNYYSTYKQGGGLKLDSGEWINDREYVVPDEEFNTENIGNWERYIRAWNDYFEKHPEDPRKYAILRTRNDVLRYKMPHFSENRETLKNMEYTLPPPVEQPNSTYVQKPVIFNKQGGQMNVIPEGALHARKNNMEGAGEDFTAKGIPVVDNNGEQQAEVEKEEWTMTKELTEDVEKWYHKFYNEETSQKEKDELAIKCGKRICEELLHNTDDRAKLIEKMLEEEE